MLVKISKSFLRKSWDAGIDVLKGKNVERMIEKKEKLKPLFDKRNARLGKVDYDGYQRAANKADAMINREKLKTKVTRGGLFGGIVAGAAHGATAGGASEASPEQYKMAAESDRPNIPVDTSKPTSASPTDGMDYYDYQEWVAAETGNAPDRTNLPVLGKDEANTPLKVAHELGCDLYVIDAIKGYQGDREIIKEAGIPPAEYTDEITSNPISRSFKDRLAKSRGSKLLGAAMIAGAGYAAAQGASRLFANRPDFRHDWYN